MIMKITTYQDTFKLDGPDIDRFSEQLDGSLRAIEMERQNRLRIRLSVEEAMLRMRDRFGEDQEVNAYIGKRMGRLMIRIESDGDAFNPLSAEENDLDNLCSSLLTAVGLIPQYSYSGRRNLLRLSLPLPGLSPAVQILIGVLGGVLIGVLGNLLLPAGIQNFLISAALTPLYDAWLRLLNVLSGPVIFLMAISTVINSGEIAERGGDTRMIVARYFLLSFAMTALAAVTATRIYGLVAPGALINRENTRGLIELILNTIPEDIVTPFSASFTPQLLLIALVLGSALNVLGNRGQNLCQILRQGNLVGLQLCDWLSKLVPWMAALLVGLEIWQKRTETLTGLWLALLIALAVACICIFLVLLYVGRKMDVSVRLLMKKIKEPFWTALKTGSLDASYGLTEHSCIWGLGIRRNYASVGIPSGLVLYMPISAVGTTIFIIFAAVETGVSASPQWIITAVILAVVVFVATPPVPGANLLAYVVALSVLGIPNSALIDAMVFDLVFGIFASAGNQALLQMELVLQADRIGMLNRRVLQRDV